MKRSKGSVTIFCSLIFLVISGFILSFFELAAYTARTAYHAAAASLAVENYLADYVPEMFDEYEIFAKDTGNADRPAFVSKKEFFVSEANREIGADVEAMTCKKEGEKSLLLRNGADFSVDGPEYLTDNDAQGFYLQAVESMEYRGIEELREKLTVLAGGKKNLEKQLEVTQAQADTAEAYAVMEEKLLNLIELTDGVVISKLELFLQGKGTYFLSDSYVKYFYTDRKEAEEYFERADIYKAFCENSVDGPKFFEQLSGKVQALALETDAGETEEESLQKKSTDLKTRQMLLEKEKERLDAALERMEKELAKKENEEKVPAKLPEEAEQLIKQRDEVLGDLELLVIESKAVTEAEKKLAKRKKALEKEYKSLVKEEKKFLTQAKAVRNCCEKAQTLVKEIRTSRENAQRVKGACEAILESSENILGKEAVEDYRRELERYACYENAKYYDFTTMWDTLQNNYHILNRLEEKLVGNSSGELAAAASELAEEAEQMKGYSFRGLCMYYGNLSVKNKEKFNGLEMIKGFLSKNLVSFVTDTELSKQVLDTNSLPSGFAFAGEKEPGLLATLGGGIKSATSAMRDLIASLGSEEPAWEEIADPLLFQAYLLTHFGNYTDKTPGALSYQQEYLVGGKEKDTDNLSYVVAKLCLLRGAMHLVSLYSDSVAREQAHQTALTCCGLIALPALSAAVMFAILLTWAFEEALTDVSALLLGNRLTVFPGKADRSFSYSELLLFNRQRMLEKARGKQNKKGIMLSYGDFLNLLLFTTNQKIRRFRALDLIQENLRLTRGKSFRIKNCVWKINYTVDSRRYSFSYVKE